MNPSRPGLQLWMLRLMMLILITGLPGALLPGIAFRKFSWLIGVWRAAAGAAGRLSLGQRRFCLRRDRGADLGHFAGSGALSAARANVRLEHGDRGTGLSLDRSAMPAAAVVDADRQCGLLPHRRHAALGLPACQDNTLS